MTYEMEMQKLKLRERKRLNSLVAQNRSEIEGQLQEMGRRLFYLGQEDALRLLNLKWWAEKYAVDTGTILQILIGHYAGRFRSKRLQNKRVGFGVRVATLTGKSAELVLKSKLKEMFLDDEQFELRAQHRRWEILDQRLNGLGEEDGIQTRNKTILDFERPQQYVQYYRKKMTSQRKMMDREMAKKSNRQFAYRGNPWL